MNPRQRLNKVEHGDPGITYVFDIAQVQIKDVNSSGLTGNWHRINLDVSEFRYFTIIRKYLSDDMMQLAIKEFFVNNKHRIFYE